MGKISLEEAARKQKRKNKCYRCGTDLRYIKNDGKYCIECLLQIKSEQEYKILQNNFENTFNNKKTRRKKKEEEFSF